MNDINFLIVDWGTTNFRAFAMSEDGELIGKKEASLGLLQIEDDRFAENLEQLLSGWLENYKHMPILMAGMVGSAQGWKNTPYVQAPACYKDLAEKSITFTLPWGASATIIPGVSCQDRDGIFDVMRGEEVQLIGLAELCQKSDFTAILPGTHSKHARFKGGCLSEFSTLMTGELFSIISSHSLLGRNLPEQKSSSAAFLKGVREGQSGALAHRLFSARTHRLFNNLQECEVHDYLSGVLISHELQDLSSDDVYLVGSKALCERYTAACDELNIKSAFWSGNECFLQGMLKIKQELNNV